MERKGSRFILDIILKVPFRHPRGDVTKATGGVLARDRNLYVIHILY